MKISVAARSSPLSRRQVEEVFETVTKDHVDVAFSPRFVKTHGDEQLDRSLRLLDKTDFFTREVDAKVLSGECRIAVHSAKDLPLFLPTGLSCIAITEGQSRADALVLPEGETLSHLKKNALIGSSSLRRDRIIWALRPDLRCKEVRGSIGMRLSHLQEGKIEGLVVAEAALIRLGLTRLNRIILPGETAPLQGQLAIIAKKEDREMREIFSSLDTRQKHAKQEKKGKTWYTGLTCPQKRNKIIHIPLIEVKKRSFHDPSIQAAFADLSLYTHILFTSKQTVRFFFEALFALGYTKEVLARQTIMAIGDATAHALRREKIGIDAVAKEATQEGLLSLIRLLDIREDPYWFLPQSSLARPHLAVFMRLRGFRFRVCFLYDTFFRLPVHLPKREEVEEILFTSPSAVRAFFSLPNNPFCSFLLDPSKLRAIGPVTNECLTRFLQKNRSVNKIRDLSSSENMCVDINFF